MPIRREVRQFYGAEHRRARADLIAILGPICQHCHREHDRVNLAHLAHDSTDKRFVTLLCPSCHAKHDATQRFAMTRRTRARRRGQLWLLESIEWAPFAAWEIPDPVRDRATQASLFESVTVASETALCHPRTASQRNDVPRYAAPRFY